MVRGSSSWCCTGAVRWLATLEAWKVLEVLSVLCWASAVLAAQQMTPPATLPGSEG